MADHVVNALVPTGTNESNVEGAAQVLLEDWRGAGDGLGIHHWHGVPQVRVVCVGDGLGAIALDLSIPVRAFVAPPISKLLAQGLPDRSILPFGNGGLACSDDVQGGGWHGTGEPMFDIGTCTTMLSENQTF